MTTLRFLAITTKRDTHPLPRLTASSATPLSPRVRVHHRLLIVPLLSAAATLACCTSLPPPSAVAWRNDAPTIRGREAGRGIGPGILVVETDTDLVADGAQTWANLRRSYDLFDSEGRFLLYVENRQGRGEDPEFLQVPAGRYVVASVNGTTYRRVQVAVVPDAVTTVREDELRDAAPVYTP